MSNPYVGFIGPGLFGKSYAAQTLSRRYWTGGGRRSIVHDPNDDPWGPHALVFTDKDAFWTAVWHYTDCAVFADEFGENNYRTNEATPLFTRLRHQRHLFHVITHDWTDMLPKQRNQLGTLFLFWQTEKAAKTLCEEWSDPRLMEATKLPQYDFLYCRKFAQNPAHLIERSRFPAP